MDRNITEALKIPESVRVPIFGGLWYKLLCKLDNQSIRKEQLPENPLNTEEREEKVIVSLTSYPARIACVPLAVKSLMLQSYKPDRILLWLAEEQFPNKKVPKEVADLQEYGLEIFWMHDLCGHKRYFYPIQNQKEDEIIITFDDDIIYSKNAIKRLMEKHWEYKDCVICERGQTISEDYLMNPGRWKTISDEGVNEPTYRMNPSPGGGLLLPKGALPPEVCDEEKIRNIVYRNDDVWFMFMCAQNGTKMIKTRKNHPTFSVVEGSQVEQLATGNIIENKAQGVMEKLIRAYPMAWERIKSGK